MRHVGRASSRGAREWIGFVRRLAVGLALAAAPAAAIAGSGVAPVTLTPIATGPGMGNQADLTLLNTTFGNPSDFDTDTSYVQVGSSVDVELDLGSNTLTMTDATLLGSDVDFFPVLDIDVQSIVITLDTGSPLPSGVVSGGSVTLTDVDVLFSADVEGTPITDTPATIPTITGTLTYDGGTGDMTLTGFSGALEPVNFEFSGFTFELSGDVFLDLEGNGLPVDPEVFSEDFESGDLSAWTLVVP